MLQLLDPAQQAAFLSKAIASLAKSADSNSRAAAAQLIGRLTAAAAPHLEGLLLPALLRLAADADVPTREV